MNITPLKAATKTEVLQLLGVQSYILSLWEKKAGIAPISFEGEMLYSQEDISKLLAIKELLYEKGYTLDAALSYNKIPSKSPPLLRSMVPTPKSAQYEVFEEKLQLLRAKLISLRKLL